MNSRDWEKRSGDFIGEIAGDRDLSDADYIEVLQDLVSLAESSIAAKQAELEEDAEAEADES